MVLRPASMEFSSRKTPLTAIFLQIILAVDHRHYAHISKITFVTSVQLSRKKKIKSPGLSSSPFQGMAWRDSNSWVVECAVWPCTLGVKPTMLKMKAR